MSENVSELIGRAQILAARLENQHDAEVVRVKLEDVGYDARELTFICDSTKCSFTFDGIGDHVAKNAADGSVGGRDRGGVRRGPTFLRRLAPNATRPNRSRGRCNAGWGLGLLLGLGMNSDQATACEEVVSGGSVVMTVQAHAADSVAVRAALGEHFIAAESDDYFDPRTSPTRPGLA